MKRFDLCIFDFNGTLQDDLRYIYECGPRRIFEQFGLPCPDLEQYRNEVTADFMSSFYWPHGIPGEVTAEDLNVIMKQAMREPGRRPAQLFPDALATLAAVQAAGCQNVMVSAYDSAKLSEAVRRHRLGGYFTHVVGDVRDKAAEFRRLMGLCGIGPSRTLAVGDTVEDALAAAEAGIVPFLCPRGFHTRERIDEVCRVVASTVVIDDLASLLDHVIS